MSPEYALEGLFSTKSDVFSFGVLLLEILSGKKNTGFYQSDSLNLLGFVSDKIFLHLHTIYAVLLCKFLVFSSPDILLPIFPLCLHHLVSKLTSYS